LLSAAINHSHDCRLLWVIGNINRGVHSMGGMTHVASLKFQGGKKFLFLIHQVIFYAD